MKNFFYGAAVSCLVLIIFFAAIGSEETRMTPSPSSTPRTIVAGGYKYQIVHASATSLGEKYGETWCDPRKIISLADDMAPDQERITLYHEVAHIAYCELKRVVPRPPEGRIFTEEQSVELQGHFMVQTLRDNPELVRYLTH